MKKIITLCLAMLLISCSSNNAKLTEKVCPFGKHAYAFDTWNYTEEEKYELCDLYYVVSFTDYAKDITYTYADAATPMPYTRYTININEKKKGNLEIDSIYLFIDHSGCITSNFEEKVKVGGQKYAVYLKFDEKLNGYNTVEHGLSIKPFN